MAGQTPTASSSSGVAFLVSAGIVYEIVAAACSSPQTTEINADKRSETLFKWVYLGLGQAAAFVLVAAAIDKPHRGAIVMGGAAAGVIMYASYYHARAAGLSSNEPGTEGQDTPWMLKKTD
jgi:uncharacterized membrane protein